MTKTANGPFSTGTFDGLDIYAENRPSRQWRTTHFTRRTKVRNRLLAANESRGREKVSGTVFAAKRFLTPFLLRRPLDVVLAMKSKEIATIEFVDAETSDSAVAIIRLGNGAVGLALSLSRDGDVEVFLSPSDTARLVDALREAIDRIMGLKR
jgi:hypothetical protein